MVRERRIDVIILVDVGRGRWWLEQEEAQEEMSWKASTLLLLPVRSWYSKLARIPILSNSKLLVLLTLHFSAPRTLNFHSTDSRNTESDCFLCIFFSSYSTLDKPLFLFFFDEDSQKDRRQKAKVMREREEK